MMYNTYYSILDKVLAKKIILDEILVFEDVPGEILVVEFASFWMRIMVIQEHQSGANVCQ